MFLIQRNVSRCARQLRTFVSTSVSSSKNEGSSGDDDKKNKDKEDTINRLNQLLQIMVQEDATKVNTASQSLELSKPKKRFNQKSQKGLGDRLKDAAKDVAQTVSGDPQQTEAELLGKLLGKSSSSGSLNDLLSGMKIEKTPAEELSRAQQVRISLKRGSERQRDGGVQQDTSVSSDLMRSEVRKLRKRVGESVDIFGSEPSKYFTNITPATDVPKMDTWEKCVNRELRLAVTHPPSNIYEQFMIWTDRGILWKFPIDNEQGLEDEKKVSFEDHIFLETHLEGWIPEKGPIKHFMELVVVGLSKNFWMTAEEKKQHILWYRDYFKDKNALLKELGAGTIAETEEQKENTVKA